MKVIVCAAGNSKRMGKLTKNIPKPLLPLGEKSIIENLIESIAIEPVKEIIIVTGYHADQIKRKIGNNFKGIEISYVRNDFYYKTNNMYSIFLARDKIDGKMAFISADVFLTAETCRTFLHCNQENSILVDENPVYFSSDDPVKVTINNGVITAIDKKLLREQISGVAIGMYKFSVSASQTFLRVAGEYVDNGYLSYGYIEPIKVLIKNNLIEPFYIKGEPWCDIDTPDEYRSALVMSIQT